MSNSDLEHVREQRNNLRRELQQFQGMEQRYKNEISKLVQENAQLKNDLPPSRAPMYPSYTLFSYKWNYSAIWNTYRFDKAVADQKNTALAKIYPPIYTP